MLEIFNRLKPFFEDNYRRINVREYARIQKISPPSASKILKSLEKENILRIEEEKRYLYFYANRKSKLFISFQRMYYLVHFQKVLDYFKKELISPVAILFGSFAKAEINKNSDIDLAIFTQSEKQLNLKKFEKELGRNIQLFVFKKREDLKNKMLLNNILNGFIILGSW